MIFRPLPYKTNSTFMLSGEAIRRLALEFKGAYGAYEIDAPTYNAFLDLYAQEISEVSGRLGKRIGVMSPAKTHRAIR